MDQVGLARMVIAYLEIRQSGIRPSVSKPWIHDNGRPVTFDFNSVYTVKVRPHYSSVVVDPRNVVHAL